MTKHFVFTLMTAIAWSHTPAQDSTRTRNSAERNPTFWEIQSAFYAGRESGSPEEENGADGELQHFKRWEWFAAPRTYPSGEFPDPGILLSEYHRYQNISAQRQQAQAASANWSYIGPFSIPNNPPLSGAGRINCMMFDPVDTNIIWAGAACGGLWKTADGGQTWTTNTDLLPSQAISDIAIDPVNPQVMYVATGDKYGFSFLMWQYSSGVMKSTDGGLTWNTTGLNYAQSGVTIIHRLVVNPSSTNILYAATNAGFFKSTDGAATWTQERPGSHFDIEFNPLNPATIYVSDTAGIARTTNGGLTWNYVNGVTANGTRMSIVVTAADPAVVYVWTGLNFYYSNDTAQTFIPRFNPSGAMQYGYYDLVLEVSQADANVLFAGGVNVCVSTDGGVSWNCFFSNTCHLDLHDFKFLPGSATTVFACSDGGLYKSTDQGTTFTDLSAQLYVKQYYGMGSSVFNSNIIIAGSQDNGAEMISSPGNVIQMQFGDGTGGLVDHTNGNVMFYSMIMGSGFRSSDGGANWYGVATTGCAWVSPLIMDPVNHNIMYSGGLEVYKSVNNGLTWNSSSPALDNTCIVSLCICPSNSNYIYAATEGNIFRSTDAGLTWNNITSSLSALSAAITDVAVSSADPDDVWVTFSGYSAGNKIYRTTNGGVSWTNVSGTLPNLPVNTIVYRNGSNDELYCGTDMGVFYMDASLTDWSPYNTGLPNAIITDLEVYYPSNTLRAATFGRGIWETAIPVGMSEVTAAGKISIYPNPFENEFQIDGLTESTEIKIFSVLGEDVTGSISVSQNRYVYMGHLPPGVYFLEILRDGVLINEKIVKR